MQEPYEIKFEVDENPKEGYPLASGPESKKEYVPYVADNPPKKGDLSEPQAKRPFQYSIADLFALTTGVAAFMSILSMIPAGLKLSNVAGITGLGAFISLVLLSIWPPEQPFLRLGWWVLFALYMLACIGAIIFG